MSDPNKYTVGWICAITTEFVAARAFLDEEHDGPCQVAQHDNNSYVLGKISSHNVVIAVLPDAEYGIASAAAVARDMLHSFPNVRIGLMVGIGGGAPSRKRDVRLGDVVVSSRAGGQSGVFQYDYGKTIQNQAFQETGFLDPPPMVLRTAMSKLKSTYEMDGHKLVDDVNRALKKIKKRKKYIRPPPESDRLYRSNVVHPAHSTDSCDVTCSNDEANLVVRVERDAEEDDPAIHYGLIASGNQLMKDALIRDKLADDRGVLCFEMESAGLMNHFPCLVIRGICDYSDSHKNKEWQGFAAMMAAAYSRDLLHQIPANKIQEERRISEVLGSIREDLGQLHQIAKEAKTIVATSQLERWLRPPDTSTNFNQARKKWHEGSGQWFLNSATFNEWKHGSRRHLWLYGLAGCGKTVLSTTIVNQLQKMQDCFVLEFYFDFNETVKQQVDGVLRSLLFQLYKIESHPEHLDNLFKSCQDGQRQPDVRTMSRCLRTMTKGSKTIFVILDALDECIERRNLLEWLKELFTAPDLNHVRLLATSRPEEEFLSFIPSWLGEEHCLQLDKQAVNSDIRSYVEARLEQSPEFVSKRLSEDLLEQIRKQIGNGADGMFRWAACQLDSLAICMSPRAIENALGSLPRDLDETYCRMIQSIPVDIEKDAIRLLQFLVHTKRPLAVSEAVEVIATQADEMPQGFDAKRRLFRETDVLRYCPSLVSLIEVSGFHETGKELHLAHFSVKEYLLKQDQFDLTSSCIVMTRTCLSYLADVEGDYSRIQQGFPLARYAAQFWTDYATLAETSGEVVQAIVKFLQNETTFKRWCQLYQADYYWHPNPGPPRASRLYYIALSGLLEVVKDLIAQGADVNVKGGRYGNALQAASQGGHKEIVQLLLQEGADVNTQGGFYGNALQAALQGGHKEIVQLLLQEGAEVNAQGGFYGNALQAASQGGHKEIVQLLLQEGANVNAQGGYYGNALQAASYHGRKEIVQLLLQEGADVNAQGGSHGNALQAASYEGHKEIVHLLLQEGADVNTQGEFYGNALQAASRGGHKEIVQLLLQEGADVNAKGGSHGNALQAASYEGHKEIVHLLLQEGAVVNTQDEFYGNALQAASQGGHKEIVQLLLQEGANVNAQGGYYGNALQAASYRGRKEIVQLLLQEGADVNVQGGEYRNALQAASFCGDKEIVQLLLQEGADVNAQDGFYGNALQAASQGGHKEIVQLLLQEGADVNAKGGSHGNALQAASICRDKGIVQLLLQEGADVNVQGGFYGNALQAASYHGRKEIVQLLLQEGADVNVQGGEYRNALQAASFRGDKEIVQLLLQEGADVNAQGGFYGNALQAASQGGHKEIVQLLLQEGAEVNAQGGFYGNALQADSYHGRKEIVHILLQEGAGVNAQGSPNGNAY